MVIPFYKYSGSGNDFLLVNATENDYQIRPSLVRNWCQRKDGVGADGVILFSKGSEDCDYALRIWNSDGSEAEMCGNAARCSVHFAHHAIFKNQTNFTFKTMNGVYFGSIIGDEVRVKMTELYDVESIDVSDFSSKIAFYCNTGVPHTVLQVSSVEDVNVESLGSVIRNDVRFTAGTNVDFFEIVNNEKQIIKLRVYERGVEAETLCCGTGIMATAVACAKKLGWSEEITVHAKGGLLKAIVDKKLSDLYFQGKVKLVFQGEAYCE